MVGSYFYQQEEIKKQTKLHGSQAMDGGSSMPQASTGGFFGGTAPFGQSGGSFGSGGSVIPSGGFSAVPSTSSQSGVFGSGNANNQSGLFGQSSVSGLTGSVFGNNANSTNQTMSGISSSFPATNQSGGLFGTSPDQSAASSGLFGAKTDLKPGLFGSASIPSSGLFSSGPQLQKDSGTISATSITPNNSIVSAFHFFCVSIYIKQQRENFFSAIEHYWPNSIPLALIGVMAIDKSFEKECVQELLCWSCRVGRVLF